MNERRRSVAAAGLAVAGVLCVLGPMAIVAPAQTWSTAEIARCTSLEDDAERLACFDRIAAETLSAAAAEDDGTQRYSTVIEGRGEGRHYALREHGIGFRDIRIVAFVHEHRRGRDWRRYVSDDGRYWRLPDDQPDRETELPFEAEVLPDPDREGGYLLRPDTGGELIRVLPEFEGPQKD